MVKNILLVVGWSRKVIKFVRVRVKMLPLNNWMSSVLIAVAVEYVDPEGLEVRLEETLVKGWSEEGSEENDWSLGAVVVVFTAKPGTVVIEACDAQ